MNQKKEENIEFKLINIEIIESEIKAPIFQLESNIDFNFDVNIEQQISLDHDLVIVVCDISVSPIGNQDVRLGKYRSNCIFKVNDLKKFISINDEIVLPSSFLITINSVAISTTRGMMYSFFKGTFLHDAILPLIDTKQFTSGNRNEK